MNEQKLLTNAFNASPEVLPWIRFALYLADFAILFFFAHRLFRKKNHSFAAINLCAVGGAAFFAFASNLLPDFNNPVVCLIFNCMTTVFAAAALNFIYKDKAFFKTAYALIYMSVFTVIDILLINLCLMFNMGFSAFLFGYDKSGAFVALYCGMLRVLRAAAAAPIYGMLRRISLTDDEQNRSMLCYTSVIVFIITQLLGIFTTDYFEPSISFHDMFTMYTLLSAALFAGIILLLRNFPKMCRRLRANDLDSGSGASFTFSSNGSDGLSPREMQKLRHDVKNNVATISALIDSGNASEAKRMLDELGARLGSALGGENKTGIPAVDTAVSKKTKICEELSIFLDIHAEPLPETKIPPIDLSSVISNILDNAVEAAQGCESPVITLRIFKYKSYLAVICENPTDAAPVIVNGRLSTTKDGEGHGFGIEIVSEICKNNNGRFQYEFENNSFKASAFLEL